MTNATDWDLQWRENGERFNAWPNEELVRWASTLERGSRVLEVGFGAGANLWALQSFDLDAWGVDIAEEAVRRSAGSSWASQVKLGSAVELEFPSESFDAVCDVQCLQHLPADELPRAYSEVHRVLKPGGRFFTLSITDGLKHFPDLHFNCAGSEPLEKHGGFSIVKDGMSYRKWDGRSYAYVMLECERV